jgi:hypothetical protein
MTEPIPPDYVQQEWQDNNPLYPLSALRMKHIEAGLSAEEAFTKAVEEYIKEYIASGAGAVVIASEAEANAHTWAVSGETVFANATAGAFTQPLPAATSGNKGWKYTVISTATNTNAVTVKPVAGELRGPGPTFPAAALAIGSADLYLVLSVISDGSNYRVI